MKILVAQLGARRHYAVPRALAAHGILEACVTDLCADAAPLNWIGALMPSALQPAPLRRALGRRAPGLPSSRIHNEIGFALSPRFTRRSGERQTDYWARRNAAFGRAVARRGFGGANTIYAFNAAALEIFESAKRQNLRCVLDQTAAPWRYNTKLLRAETQRWPGWETEPAEIDESGRLSAREEAEWRLADVIVCGSNFARDALLEIGGPKDKCVVVPYGGHIEPLEIKRGMPPPHNRKIRALTIGSVQLRKGAPYLMEAAQHLSDLVEFRWVGPNLLGPEPTAMMQAHLDLAGQAQRAAVWKHYAWADIFVLPTLSEGSANVIYEAMAAGLPIVTTPNAGSDIEPGATGIIVAPRDGGALAEAIGALAGDQDLRDKLSVAALAHANHRSLNTYGLNLARSIAAPVTANVAPFSVSSVLPVPAEDGFVEPGQDLR